MRESSASLSGGWSLVGGPAKPQCSAEGEAGHERWAFCLLNQIWKAPRCEPCYLEIVFIIRLLLLFGKEFKSPIK